MNKIEVVRISVFPSLKEIREAERKKSLLENAGYALVGETYCSLIYRRD